MLTDDATEPVSRLSPRRRFRFGLRTLFIVMTVLCLWLGYRVIRERRAAEILARHEAILSVLVKQVDTAPTSTFYSISSHNGDELLDRFGYPDKRFRRATALRVDHSDSTTRQKLVVDVSKLLDSKTHPTTIADQLIQLYGRALVPLGFVQTLSHGDTISQGNSIAQGGKTIAVETSLGACRGIWSSPNGDINVVIDGQVFAPSKQAIVTVLLIDSQHLQLW